MTRAPSIADAVIAAYLVRFPDADELRATESMYAWQIQMLRHTLALTEMALEDEHVDEATRERVLRAVLYGSAPCAVEAKERRREHLEQLAQLSVTPDPDTMRRVLFPQADTPPKEQ